MDIPWDDLRLFLAVAEARSFSAAARALRLAQPTLSRRMAALEAALDEPLFLRGTAGVSLTAAAERLLPMARNMAEWAAEGARGLAQREQRPEGRVRIAAPPGLAFDFLGPVAALMARKNPGLRLEVLAGIEYLSLSRGEADLALRTRSSPDGDLTVLAEIKMQVGTFASRSYARRLPPRLTLSDIDWIGWAPPYDQLPPNPQLAAAIPGFRPIFTSNDYLVQVGALIAGVGAMVLGMPFHRHSRTRELVQLDVDIGKGATFPLFLVAARRMLDVPRIRATVDFILGQIEDCAVVDRQS